jgi:hypothetical protein
MKGIHAMRRLLGVLAAAVGLGVAGAAAAGPSVEIDNAALHVVIAPEARSDIHIDILRGNPRLPLRIWSFLGRTYIDGGLDHRIQGCGGSPGQPAAFIWGLGQTPLGAMPQIVIHVPLDVQVSAGGAVWGEVGRSASLDLANAGCGAWVAGDVRGKLRISEAGSGAARAGAAGSAELSVAGSGDIAVGQVAGAVSAMDLGSGNIDVAAVNGPFNVRIAGSGHVRAASGRVSLMQASIAGSGGVWLNGVAGQLHASVMGSGDVRVARVTGEVTKAVMGSGEVRVGS